MKELKDRLRAARSKAGLTQVELCEAAGITAQSTLGDLEGGRSKTTGYICRLAKALEVDPYWLETGIGSMDAEPSQTEQEKRMLKLFSRLSPEGKIKIEERIDVLLSMEQGGTPPPKQEARPGPERRGSRLRKT